MPNKIFVGGVPITVTEARLVSLEQGQLDDRKLS